MRTRTLGRRLALQYLFMAEINNYANIESIEDFFYLQRWSVAEATGTLSELNRDIESNDKQKEAEDFACQLIVKVLENRDSYDKRIINYVQNWTLSRIGLIERNVLRLSLAELSDFDTPVNVVVNEAIELAKCFVDENAGKFVNGILDKLAKDL